jgi:hypothetical protein
MSKAVRDIKKQNEIPMSSKEKIAAEERDALSKFPDLAAQKDGRGSGAFREGGVHDSGRQYFSKK